jgi:hypothetical protein
VTLDRSGLRGDAEAWISDGAQEYRMEPGRPLPVPAGVPLTLRVRDAVADRTHPLGPILEDRTVEVPWPAAPDPPATVASPVPAPHAAPRGAGSLALTLRDAGGRFLSGFASLDGHPPLPGARPTWSHVPAGPHRVAVWAEGHEALVIPADVTDGGTTRLQVRLRALPAD